MTKLSWANYEELQKEMDQISHFQRFSALTLLSWVYYGINIEFEITTLKSSNSDKEYKAIYLFAKFNRLMETIEDDEIPALQKILKNGDHFLILPLFDKNELSIKELVQKSYKQLVEKYPKKSKYAIEGIPTECLDELAGLKYEKIYSWSSNFIYNIEQMKFFAGRKMQKKRNHLNYFLKTFALSVISTKFTQADVEEIKKFVLDHTKNSTNGTSLKNEWIFMNDFFENWNRQTMSGLVIRTRSSNKIIAFTAGHLHEGIYEVFFEKANKFYRGLYPYLISQNLKINNINCNYMDRQDDAWSDVITFSKFSYHPLEVVELNMICVSPDDLREYSCLHDLKK